MTLSSAPDYLWLIHVQMQDGRITFPLSHSCSPRQPPKKKAKTATPAKATSRRSKLAKDNDISAEQETEIKSAWSLFHRFDVENFEEEKEGVIRTTDVERALKYQPLPLQANLLHDS